MTDEQRGSASVYNLRVRDNSQADTDASQSDTTAESDNRVRRTTAAAARAIRDSVTRVRGFGRGHGKNSPAQGRIDTMFHTQRSANEESNASAQSNKTGVVDGSDANDTDALFNDAADTKEYGRPRFIQSVPFLLYNVAGIASKLSDCDWVKYVEQFDFVTLVETFVENTFDMSGIFFSDYVKFVCPAVKLSYQGRRSGGVIVMVKKHISKFVERISVQCDNVIVLKLSRTLLGTEDVPPTGSPFYDSADSNCYIAEVEKCICDLLEELGDVNIICIGDFNARTANY